MLTKWLVAIGVSCAIVLFSCIVGMAEEENAPEYVGLSKCKICHKNAKKGLDQYGWWKEDKHSKAFESLKSEEGKKIAKEKGIEDPTKAKECLVCHITGYGKKGKIEPENGNTCEACHGPGSKYRKSHIRNKEQAKKDGLIKPTEETCKRCHNEKSPTHKPLDFKEAFKKIDHKIKKP